MKYILLLSLPVILACSISAAQTPARISFVAPASLASPVAMQVGERATVSAIKAVRVRERATEHSRTLGYLYNGKSVIVISCVGSWAKIDGGFVNGRYLGGVCK